MLVQKYGGTSVENIEKIKAIANNVKRKIRQNKKIIIVVSAMGKTTDNLIKLSKEISLEPNKREVDQLISTGENQTASLMAMALNQIGVKTISLTGFQAGIITDTFYGGAFINEIKLDKIKNYFKKFQVLVITGFQGMCKNGDITTLGKGGSDTTAVALASKLKCSCEIFTDVSGIFTADPKLLPLAKKLDAISYDDLMEMSANGAKVMETRSVEIAKKFGVPLYVGRSMESKKEGTKVMKKVKNLEFMPIKNITIKDNVGLLEMVFKDENLIPEILLELSKIGQKLEMFSLVENENKFILNCSINENNVQKIENLLKNNKKIINFNIFLNNYCKFTLVGSGFATHSLIAKDVFLTLSESGIAYKNISISEISISFLIDKNNKEKALNLLAKKLNL